MGNGNNIGLTDNQQYVFDKFKAFIKNNEQRFLSLIHAGTGKHAYTIFIDELKAEGRNYKLMASTGRAAKILTNITGTSASTVRSVIYSFRGFNQNLEEIARQVDATGVDKTGQLFLNFELTHKEPTNEQYFILWTKLP